jgi:uncharacterized PurR-regulated membrane protein YhhQ (DUF165 family)
MGKMNVRRLILGGIVAGMVFNLVDYLVDVVILGPQWTEGFKALGHNGFSTNQLIGSGVTGLVGGTVAVWIYVGIRPRFGAGPKTAIYAGLAVWVVGILLPNLIFMRIFGLFPGRLTLMTTLGALVETLPGAVAGAAIYKEA